MQAFVALIWDKRNEDQANTVRDLIGQQVKSNTQAEQLILDGCVLINLGSGPTSSPLTPIFHERDEPTGGVVGTFFRNSSPGEAEEPVSKVTRHEARRLLSSDGASLASDFWGNYIGFIQCGSTICVVSTPTSSVPCYYLTHKGVTIVFSHLEKCCFIDSLALSINARFISALVAYDRIQNGETGFNEIQELIGGSRLRVNGGATSVDTVWSPKSFVSPLRLNLQDYASLLRETTNYVVQSWANAYGEALINLSGGLDSTIVLSCLKQHPVIAIHQIPDSEDPSEVQFARAAAKFVDCRLEEVRFMPAGALPERDSHPKSARPFRQFLSPDMSKSIRRDFHSMPIFTGQGGDHLFHVRKTTLGFADYLRDSASYGATFSELLSAANLSEHSIWRVLADAASDLSTRHRSVGMVASIAKVSTPIGLRSNIDVDLRACLPRWAVDYTGVPSAKFDQLSSMVHLFLVRQVLDRPIVRNYVHPLISQPLIELCLQIPVYALCPNGMSRGLARRAFRGAIPESIRNRMTKGETSRYFVDQVGSNIDTLRDVILNGELVRRGYFSVTDGSTALSRDQSQIHKFGHRILYAYAIECWLRQWRHLA